MFNTVKRLISILLLGITSGLCAQEKTNSDIKTLIVFFDGLRPDYITPDVMPNLYAFSREGCYGKQHHSVFPTVTRVNASSYSSGTYPDTHGLMGNTVYFPEINKTKGLNTGDYNNLNAIAEATKGHLLTATTLGEVLHNAGARMMVFSSGSTGQAFLQNHTVSGGAIVNPELILPGTFKETIVKDLGSIPPAAEPNTAQHKWITDALLRYALIPEGPLVSAIWYSDPDGVAHAEGIGADASMESIRIVDAEFGRILQTLKSRNLNEKFNIIVSADHGFITYVGKENIMDLLIKQGLKKGADSGDIVVVGGAIYVRDHDPGVIRKVVSLLQSQEWIGAIFTKGSKPGDTKGWVDGTLSFESIHWDHPERSADILVDKNWDDRKNDKGFAGASYSEGVAGHGGLSPYEVRIALLASGPSFRKNYESELPTSNVDIAPTILSIYNLTIPASMKGRVMTELFTSTKTPPEKPTKEVLETTATFPGGVYVLRLERTVLGKYYYVDLARVTRSFR